MKAMHLIIAMLVMMSLASCSADGNDPVENSVSTYLLKKILMLKKNLIFKLPPKENKHGLEL